MALNLKQIFYTDSDQIKLDKVNYNFDQLITNGGGPQGPVGVGGSQGAQGTMGFQGPIGITGPRGFQGPEGAAAGQHWYLIEDDPGIAGSVDTLVPKHEPGLNPPSVVIGYKSDAPEYQTPENQSQLVVHRYDSEPTSNIKLEANGVDSAFHFELTNSGDLKMYFSDADNITNTLPPNKVVYETQSFTIQDSSQAELINVNPIDSTISTNAKFKEDLEVQGKLTIASGNPDTDKIAVAKDSTGEIEFKSVQDLGGSVPVGTIVSLIPSYFEDNSKFIQEQLNEAVNATDQLIHFTVGSGVNEYAGWYICNGKTWTDGTISYNVPDLCSFSYTIDDNANSTDPNSQGSRVVTNDSIHIMGGSDINLTADFVSGAYNITATVDVNDVNIQQSTGTILKVRRLPQIIYLGTENMYWTDKGVDQAPDTTMTLNFFDVNGNISHAETKTESQGSSYTGTVTLTAPTGYIWTSTGVSFSSVSWPGVFTGGQAIDTNDPTKLHVDISWTQPPTGTYTATTYGPFNYDSANFVTQNTANYSISITGGTINYSNGSVTGGTLGQNAILVNGSNSSTYTITPPSGRIFATQNSGVNVTTPGYTFGSYPYVPPATQIQGIFSATPFTVPPANNGTIEVTVLSDLDLSVVNISNLSGAALSGGSQVQLNWSATGATSDMTWYIEGYSNTSQTFPSTSLTTFFNSQIPVTPAGNNLYSASFPIQSIPNYSAGNNWLHFRIRVAETANLTNIGLDEEILTFDFF